MHDFLAFITGTHVLNHGTNSFLLENFLEHQNVIRNFDSVSGCCSAVLGPENFSADGTKAFEIGSNILNLVFGDEFVMEDSEVWFGITYSLNDAGGFA